MINRTKRKNALQRRQSPNVCSICGARATGHHYGAIACSGCRSFFRRTVIAERIFVCFVNNDCKVVSADKTTCRACRFRKCLNEGMNALAIEDATINSNALARLLGKRQDAIHAPATKVQKWPLLNTDDFVTNRITLVTRFESIVAFLRRSTFRDENHTGQSLRFVLSSPSVLGQTLRPYSSTLLCHSSLHCMILTQVFDTIQTKSDSLRFPDGFVLLNRLKRKRYIPHGLAEAVCNQSMRPLLRLQLDEIEYALLKVIVLCDAAGLSDEGRHVIDGERNAYVEALFDYCRRSRGIMQGTLHFANAVMVLNTLVHISQKLRYLHVLLKMNHQNKRFSKYNAYPFVDELMK